MKALEELTREIYNKLPRLIYEDEFELFDESNGYRHTEKLLIPDPPMLNDVMQYLWKLVEEEHKNQDEILFGISCLTNSYDNNCWNFEKPYLKDQSPELINFLHGLINH